MPDFIGYDNVTIHFDFSFWKRVRLILALFITGRITFNIEAAEIFQKKENK